jgi:hypothetical protein
MCDLVGDVSHCVKTSLSDFSLIQENALISYQIFLDQIRSDVGVVDKSFDSQVVLKLAQQTTETEPDDFHFTPCGLWKEDVKLILLSKT